MEVFVSSYLYRGELPNEATHPDGAIQEAWNIKAEDAKGYRYVLDNFNVDCKDKAVKLEAKIIAHLASGGKLNLDHWTETEPCYGSEAYCEVYGF